MNVFFFTLFWRPSFSSYYPLSFHFSLFLFVFSPPLQVLLSLDLVPQFPLSASHILPLWLSCPLTVSLCEYRCIFKYMFGLHGLLALWMFGICSLPVVFVCWKNFKFYFFFICDYISWDVLLKNISPSVIFHWPLLSPTVGEQIYSPGDCQRECCIIDKATSNLTPPGSLSSPRGLWVFDLGSVSIWVPAGKRIAKKQRHAASNTFGMLGSSGFTRAFERFRWWGVQRGWLQVVDNGFKTHRGTAKYIPATMEEDYTVVEAKVYRILI